MQPRGVPEEPVASCTFCRIVRGEADADRVLEDANTLAFLDHRPLFPGHVLLVPRQHFATLGDLPRPLVVEPFENTQRMARAAERALEAEGTFVAINNRVSQTIPHLHVHVVPRRTGDGLRGFFWPRTPYSGHEHRTRVRDAIRAALAEQEERG